MATKRPIVVGVDGSDSSLQATRWAAAEAARRHAPLRLVHGFLWPTHGHLRSIDRDTEMPVSTLEQTQAEMDSAKAIAKEVEHDLDVVTSIQSRGPVETIVTESERAQLVVLGSRGYGGFRALLAGSTALGVAAAAHCPVAVVRGGVPDPTAAVVVGVDGTPVSEAALAFAFDEAALRGVPLVAVHAWSDFPVDGAFDFGGFAVDLEAVKTEEAEILAERLAGWSSKYPDVVQHRVIARDGAARALLEQSEHAQLVIVGTRGQGAMRRLMLGSTSHALLHHAPCPVVVVQPEWTG
jgi:nucleotide-binding universal stress UspA family protein